MESVEVLLAWMEADPVDTWELGRNDSVQSITGTRNVFVDYPELAFLLFGEEIPADMQTPSGGAGNKCDHNSFGAGVVTNPTCTAKGYTTYTCTVVGCGYSYKTSFVPEKGHHYVSGTCTTCGEAEPIELPKPQYATQIVPGQAYKFGFYSDADDVDYFFNGTMTGYYGATDTAYANGVDVYAEQVSGGYHLYFKNNSGQKQYINLVASGDHRNFTFAATATSVFKWDTAKSAFYTTVLGETCYMGTFGTYKTVGVLQESKYKDSDYVARFYTMDGNAPDTSCQHQYSSVVTPPTCTEEGYTTYTCSLCNGSYVTEKVAAKGHNYVNDKCSVCGAGKPSQSEATIDFTNVNNRTSLSKTQQVWAQNGITVTNDKASSTSDVANYCNPARFYKGSSVTVSYPGMTKIVINCAGLDAKYVNGWKSITGAAATESNGIVTVVFDSPVDSFTFANLSAQSRAFSITVYGAGGSNIPDTPPDTSCKHMNTTVQGAVNATCAADGHTGKTVCSDCGHVVSEGSVIPAGEHVFDEWRLIYSSTCTATGLERRDCDNCSHYETRDLPVLGHTDENEDKICDVCGKNTTAIVTDGEKDEDASDAATTTTGGVKVIGADCQATVSGATFGIIALIGSGAVLVLRKKKDE
jgi:hypothetical protein